MYSRIIGTGAYLPERVVHNSELEQVMETSDSWIRERTGIVSRHYAAEGQTTVDMAEQAANTMGSMVEPGVGETEADLKAAEDREAKRQKARAKK
jgi:3-oxoacyl-[acyl-carrier-protein] synthase-3